MLPSYTKEGLGTRLLRSLLGLAPDEILLTHYLLISLQARKAPIKGEMH